MGALPPGAWVFDHRWGGSLPGSRGAPKRPARKGENLAGKAFSWQPWRMGYQGNDRRRHHVYVTRNTEYHLRDGVCVAVRDRSSRAFRSAHIALNLRMEGGVRIYANGAMIPNVEKPVEGDAIFFTHVGPEGEMKQIVTSRLERVDRPAKTIVALYPKAQSAN
jgi:hypothetical protein